MKTRKKKKVGQVHWYMCDIFTAWGYLCTSKPVLCII